MNGSHDHNICMWELNTEYWLMLGCLILYSDPYCSYIVRELNGLQMFDHVQPKDYILARAAAIL